MKGLLITLEGGEGSGKSTQIKKIKEYFDNYNIPCITTREPGGTFIGKSIRKILLDPNSTSILPITELLLYTADRAQHVEGVIRPALNEGKIVICDRYLDSTIAYQCFARGHSYSCATELHKIATNNLYPDLTILLNVDPKIGLSRAWKQVNSRDRSKKEMRFENESIEFHRKVNKAYLEIANRNFQRFAGVDANEPEEIVWVNIKSILDNRIIISEMKVKLTQEPLTDAEVIKNKELNYLEREGKISIIIKTCGVNDDLNTIMPEPFVFVERRRTTTYEWRKIVKFLKDLGFTHNQGQSEWFRSGVIE